MKKLISIDIGSTYTKGILFYHFYYKDLTNFKNENDLNLFFEKFNFVLPVKRVETPTTTNHLAVGFFNVLVNLLINNDLIDKLLLNKNLISKNLIDKVLLEENIIKDSNKAIIFFENYEDLHNKKDYFIDLIKKEEIEIFYSSSAKGGLKIVAIGIVPELTLKTAKLTALSAGGKVTKSFSYKLTNKNIKEIEDENPDIILFTGGTDGGNEEINLHNAKMLSNLNIKPVILYAGNNSCAEEVYQILNSKGYIVKIAENVLPSIDKINIDDAKNHIREIFLENIVKGKGLDEISDIIGYLPQPTPLSVFNFIQKIPEMTKKIRKIFEIEDSVFENKIYNPSHIFDNINITNEKGFENQKIRETFFDLKIDFERIKKIVNFNWESFIAIDMGGATTDFYSYYKDIIEDSNVMYKGLIEPVVKRTVEGDLGMRVSAKSVFDSGIDFIKKIIELSKDLIPKSIKEELKNLIGIELDDEFQEQILRRLKDYVEFVNINTSYIPEDKEKIYFDEILASTCLRLSALRHAGKYKRIFTVNGEKFIQYGKNLKHVSLVIGSGGYLSRMNNFNPEKYLKFSYEQCLNKKELYELDEEIPLLPETIDYFQDKNYLLPLVSNISTKYAFEATIVLMNNLINEKNN